MGSYCLFQGDLPDSVIKLQSPGLQADSLEAEPLTGEALRDCPSMPPLPLCCCPSLPPWALLLVFLMCSAHLLGEKQRGHVIDTSLGLAGLDHWALLRPEAGHCQLLGRGRQELLWKGLLSPRTSWPPVLPPWPTTQLSFSRHLSCLWTLKGSRAPFFLHVALVSQGT